MGTAAVRVNEVSGIPTSHIEKDFWVTEALRSVAAHSTEESITIVFKGGTSLSKAHRLISRFSEDIDLLVVTPSGSKGAADRCLKGIASAVGSAIHVEGEVDAQSATKGVKRTVTFNYPGQHHPSGLRRGVVLELGSRGGALPAQTMSVSSLIAEHGSAAGIDLDFVEAAPFNIRVLDPVRTLVEKLMILHHAATAGDRNEQVRHARHYYDVWCLLNDPTTKGALSQWPADVLAREVEIFTRHAQLDTSPRPREGFGRSPALTLLADYPT